MSSASPGLNGASPDAVAQCFAVDELGCDELFGIDLVDLVDGENVWMIERRRCFCFLHKSTYAIAALWRRRRQTGSIFSATLRSSLVSLAR